MKKHFALHYYIINGGVQQQQTICLGKKRESRAEVEDCHILEEAPHSPEHRNGVVTARTVLCFSLHPLTPPPGPRLPAQQRRQQQQQQHGRSSLSLPSPAPSSVKLHLPPPRRSKYIIYTLLPSLQPSSKESGQREITPLYNPLPPPSLL